MSEQGIIHKGVVEKLSLCEHCVVGKSTRQIFQKVNHNTKDTLDYIDYFGLWEPYVTPQNFNELIMNVSLIGIKSYEIYLVLD